MKKVIDISCSAIIIGATAFACAVTDGLFTAKACLIAVNLNILSSALILDRLAERGVL